MERTNFPTDISPNTSDAPVHGADSIDRHCVRYDMGRTSTYEEIRTGRLHARKVGRKTLIDHDEQRRWFDSLPQMKPAQAA